MTVICFLVAWTLLLMAGWEMWTTMRDGWKVAKRMHQIPCANCQFFTGSYYLKCTANPSFALTEDAIYCSDYDPNPNGQMGQWM